MILRRRPAEPTLTYAGWKNNDGVWVISGAFNVTTTGSSTQSGHVSNYWAVGTAGQGIELHVPICQYGHPDHQ